MKIPFIPEIIRPDKFNNIAEQEALTLRGPITNHLLCGLID